MRAPAPAPPNGPLVGHHLPEMPAKSRSASQAQPPKTRTRKKAPSSGSGQAYTGSGASSTSSTSNSNSAANSPGQTPAADPEGGSPPTSAETVTDAPAANTRSLVQPTPTTTSFTAATVTAAIDERSLSVSQLRKTFTEQGKARVAISQSERADGRTAAVLGGGTGAQPPVSHTNRFPLPLTPTPVINNLKPTVQDVDLDREPDFVNPNQYKMLKQGLPMQKATNKTDSAHKTSATNNNTLIANSDSEVDEVTNPSPSGQSNNEYFSPLTQNISDNDSFVNPNNANNFTVIGKNKSKFNSNLKNPSPQNQTTYKPRISNNTITSTDGTDMLRLAPSLGGNSVGDSPTGTRPPPKGNNKVFIDTTNIGRPAWGPIYKLLQTNQQARQITRMMSARDKGGYVLTFRSHEAAKAFINSKFNNILDSATIRLTKKPSFRTDIILRNVDVSIDEQDLEQSLMINYNIHIHSTYRLTKPSEHDPNHREKINKVKITIDARDEHFFINKRVRACFQTFATELPPPKPHALYCTKCYSYEHHTSRCQARQTLCSRCRGNHHENQCSQEAKCLNCGAEDHATKDRACPKYKSVIRVLRAEQRRSYAQATAGPPPITPQRMTRAPGPILREPPQVQHPRLNRPRVNIAPEALRLRGPAQVTSYLTAPTPVDSNNSPFPFIEPSGTNFTDIDDGPLSYKQYKKSKNQPERPTPAHTEERPRTRHARQTPPRDTGTQPDTSILIQNLARQTGDLIQEFHHLQAHVPAAPPILLTIGRTLLNLLQQINDHLATQYYSHPHVY